MLSRTMRPLLAEQYSDMLAQDYRLRNVLLLSYHHTFNDLHRFDNRMLACLEGMVLLKGEASEYLRGQLDEILSVGDLFSVALFAASTEDEFLLSGCLGLVQAMPRLLPALLAVTDWMPASSTLWSLIMGHPACRAHIAVTGNRSSLPITFSEQEIVTLIEQNQCVAHLLCFLHASGSSLFIPALNMVLSSERDNIKICGCRIVLHLSESPGEYIRATNENLHQFVRSKDKDVRVQAVKYLMIYSSDESSSVINELAKQEADTRLLIQAMGWSGLTEYVPLLMSYFDESDYARLSMLSVSSITGSLPEKDGWKKKVEDEPFVKTLSESAEIPVSLPEQGVCWPDVAKFQLWWQTKRSRFSSRVPYLGGLLSTQENLSTIVADGVLNLRPLAAMRMKMLPEFTALPAERQPQIFTNLSEK
ncbi:hypothetical protein FNZ18_23120 [Salmonella enterica subsp. salamae]|nr:hypothetical protein [Salmonella enterica subsp. salamae]